jgi:hypothetical protein
LQLKLLRIVKLVPSPFGRCRVQERVEERVQEMVHKMVHERVQETTLAPILTRGNTSLASICQTQKPSEPSHDPSILKGVQIKTFWQ